MRKLLLVLTIVIMPIAAIAAEVPVTSVDPYQGVQKWDGMTGDTTSSASMSVDEGCYEFHMEGTYDADIMVQHKPINGEAFVNIDVDEAPNGLRFTSATKSLAWLSSGHVDLRFDSAGGSTMDANLLVTRLRKDC